MTTTSELRNVKPDSLDRRYAGLRLRRPGALSRLRATLRREGFHEALLASDGVEPDVLVLVDGFKRLEIAEELGLAVVEVRVVALSATEAQAAIVTSNGARRGLSQLEEGWIVASLHRQHGLPQIDIALLVHRARSWVCRRLQLVERLEAIVQKHIREGLVSPSAARELVRLPRGNQVEVAKTVAKHKLSSRDVGRLVAVLIGSPPAARSEILADPLRFLQTVEPEIDGTDARLSARGNRLRKLLLRFEAAANRLHELLRECSAGSLTPRDLDLLRESSLGSWDRAARASLKLGPLLLNLPEA